MLVNGVLEKLPDMFWSRPRAWREFQAPTPSGRGRVDGAVLSLRRRRQRCGGRALAWCRPACMVCAAHRPAWFCAFWRGKAEKFNGNQRKRRKKQCRTKDTLIIGGHEFHSRFILGSGKYSLKLIEAAVSDAGAEIITLAVRRANTKDRRIFWIIFPRE